MRELFAETQQVERRSIQHLTSCFMVGTIFSNPREVLDCGPESPHGENVSDGVAPLICWA